MPSLPCAQKWEQLGVSSTLRLPLRLSFCQTATCMGTWDCLKQLVTVKGLPYVPSQVGVLKGKSLARTTCTRGAKTADQPLGTTREAVLGVGAPPSGGGASDVTCALTGVCEMLPTRLSMGTVHLSIRYSGLLKVSVLLQAAAWGNFQRFRKQCQGAISARNIILIFRVSLKSMACGIAVFELLDTNIVFQIILPHVFTFIIIMLGNKEKSK